MNNHHIHAALAHERASTFLTEAQAARQAKQARAGRRRRPARPQSVAEGTPAVGIARYIREPGDPTADPATGS